MCKISVIIPTYNSEKYMEACLESVLLQKLKEIEILIVDAGSTDSTREIIREFMLKDERVKLLDSDKKSYGAQVNIGIDKAQGEYIAILESDDTVPADGYEKLYLSAIKTEADVVKGDFRIFITSKDGKEIYKDMILFENMPEQYGVVTNMLRMPELLRRDVYIWKGLYKRSFLVGKNIKLNETAGAAFQDNGFLFKTLILAQKIVYINAFVYNYRKDNDSSSVYSKKRMMYVADEYEYVEKFLETLSDTEQIVFFPYFYHRLMDVVHTGYVLVNVCEINRIEADNKDIVRIRKMFVKGIENGLVSREACTVGRLSDIYMFVEDPKIYESMICRRLRVQKKQLDDFISELNKYENVIIWGCGKNESILQMIFANREMKCNIIRTDIDKNKIKNDSEIKDAYEVARNYNGKDLYVICAEKYKYEIRKDLYLEYKVPIENILFYELGSSQFLIKM